MAEFRCEPEFVDIWLLNQDSVTDPQQLERYLRLLTEEERAQHGRFLFDHIKRQYLLTRTLCRATLSRYTGVALEAWRFVLNRYGKPRIFSPDPGVPIKFNLSNTHGLIACAVAYDAPVGVDAEYVLRRSDTVGIADRYFSQTEVAALRATPESRQRWRFFEYWTLKESYIKARGMGLAIPLDQFSFLLDPPKPVGISFDPRLRDDPAAWQFGLFRPRPSHCLAVGVQRGCGPDRQIRLFETSARTMAPEL